jgi:hypothetical protein
VSVAGDATRLMEIGLARSRRSTRSLSSPFLGALAFANLRQQFMPYVLDAW